MSRWKFIRILSVIVAVITILTASAPGYAAAEDASTVVWLNIRDGQFDRLIVNAPAGGNIAIEFFNWDQGVMHNFSLFWDVQATRAIFAGEPIRGPARIRYTFPAPDKPGIYYFDSYTQPMVTACRGIFVVEMRPFYYTPYTQPVAGQYTTPLSPYQTMLQYPYTVPPGVPNVQPYVTQPIPGYTYDEMMRAMMYSMDPNMLPYMMWAMGMYQPVTPGLTPAEWQDMWHERIASMMQPRYYYEIPRPPPRPVPPPLRPTPTPCPGTVGCPGTTPCPAGQASPSATPCPTAGKCPG